MRAARAATWATAKEVNRPASAGMATSLVNTGVFLGVAILQPVVGWILDQAKGILVGAVLGGILLEIIYAVLRAFPQTWWLWAAGLMLIFSVLLANLAPVVLMPLFNKFVPLGGEHQDLIDRLVRLSEPVVRSISNPWTSPTLTSHGTSEAFSTGSQPQ